MLQRLDAEEEANCIDDVRLASSVQACNAVELWI